MFGWCESATNLRDLPRLAMLSFVATFGSLPPTKLNRLKGDSRRMVGSTRNHGLGLRVHFLLGFLPKAFFEIAKSGPKTVNADQ